MLESIVDAITHFITNSVADYGYLAVFVLMLLESACIPIPSEVTMLFGGALANSAFFAATGSAQEPLNFIVVGLVGTVANLVGSWLAYWVGFVGGKPLVHRWGRYILLKDHDVERAHAWFERHGEAAVFFSRLLPVIRTFISLPAGVARMPFWRFTVYTFLGCLPWTFALAGLGYALGSQWDTVERYLRPISIVVVLALVAVVAWWIVRRVRERRRETESESASTG